MSAGGAGSGGLMRALGVDITVTADSGGVPAWIHQPDDTRQKLMEIAQRVFKDTLDGVVRFEHEHITPQSYSQALVVFALPTSAHKDIVLGGVRELASRIQEDISTRLGRMGARPTVQIIQDRSFTSGPAPTSAPVSPAMQSPGPGSGYASQGAVTTMQSTGSGDGGGPVPMVLVPAYGRQESPPPPPPPPAEEKPIIPNRLYPLLIASAIAGVSLAANAFLGSRYAAIRSENVTLSERLKTDAKAEQDRYTKLDKEFTILQERHRVFETEERDGKELYGRAQEKKSQIEVLARSVTGAAKAADFGPVPELRTAWTNSLRDYIAKQETEIARLEAVLRRQGQNAAIAAARAQVRETPVVPPSSQSTPPPR
jgi:hypothetical protein